MFPFIGELYLLGNIFMKKKNGFMKLSIASIYLFEEDSNASITSFLTRLMYNYCWFYNIFYKLFGLDQVQNLNLKVKGLYQSKTLKSHITTTHYQTFLSVPGYTSSWKSVHNLSSSKELYCNKNIPITPNYLRPSL